MESSLMDREVLCILDTRRIQQFMFRSNSYVDTLGGSDLMTHILDDGIRYAIRHVDPPLREGEYDLSLDPDAPLPYFEDGRVLFQLMINVAGNAMFIARRGLLAQKIIRKISRYYLDHGYSLNLATAAVEKTDDLGHDIFELYRKLNNHKASAEVSNPLGALPVVMRENRTGEPVIGVDEARGDYISRSSMIRRREAAHRGAVIRLGDLDGVRGKDGELYRAVIHVDGNNVGIMLGRIMQQTRDYETGIRTRRRINNNLRDQYARILRETVDQLRKKHGDPGRAGHDFAHEFQLIHASGDDVNIMCNAALAFPFVSLFFENLRSAYIADMNGRKIPLHCCAGICFTADDTGFHPAFRMAQECCDNAKAVAKREINLREGLAGNWIDFMISESGRFQNLAMLRERFFVTESNVNLMLRPYCLDEEVRDREYSWERFLGRVKALLDLKRKYGLDRLERLNKSYSQSEFLFREDLYMLKEQGLDLEAVLGAPYYRDEEGNSFTTWFDAVQVLPFFEPENAEGEGDPVWRK